MDYLLNRLSERSTRQGLAAIATGVGLNLDPQLGAAIIAFGVAAAGLVHVLFPQSGTLG
jgi:hypothetical protein